MTDGPSDAEIREALRARGVQVGARGRLSARQRAAYDALAGGAEGDDSFWDEDGQVSNDGFTAGTDGPGPAPGREPPGPQDEAPAAEQPPRRVAGPSAGARLRGMVRSRLGDQGKKSGAGKTSSPRSGGRRGKAARPWRETAGVIEGAYRQAAMAAGAIPPLQRILAAQAPAAGAVLQEQLRGTLADRVLLQPAARVEERGDAVLGMVGMPAVTAWVALRGRYLTEPGPDGPRPVAGEDGMPVWDAATTAAVGALKYCALSWLRVSRRNAEQIAARAEETIGLSAEADRLVAWIVTGVMPDAGAPGPDGAQAAPPPPRPPEPGPGPARPGGSSAFRPALTASVLPAGAP